VAEGSYAAKQAGGPWDEGLAASRRAFEQARAVLTLNPADAEGLRQIGLAGRLVSFPPFVDCRDYGLMRPAHEGPVRLLAVGMMRPGDKAASYRLLAEALRTLGGRADWHLTIAGDGPARAEILAGFDPGRITALGALAPQELPALYAASDILVWPAVNEAWGMALLEAQAAGLPVVAGREGGVDGVMEHGRTGLLTPPRDPRALAEAVALLLDEPLRRERMGLAAAARVRQHHDLPQAAARLDALLTGLA